MEKNEQISCDCLKPKENGLSFLTFSFVGNLIKKLEAVCSKSYVIQRAYYNLFYREVIKNEFRLSGLKPGDNVIHIGSGPLPLTAVYLADHGCNVKGIDNDNIAVEMGRQTVKRYNTSGKAAIDYKDGLDINLSKAEAVFVSLHVLPRKRVLQKAFSSLKENGKLIYRNPRGFLSLFYPRVEPFDICTNCGLKRVQQSFWKESVVITKNMNGGNKIAKND